LDTLSDRFGDPGIQGVTQQALGGPGVHFIDFRIILGVSWDPLWVPVCDFLLFFVLKWETVSRSMFLVIQGWK